jgi:hypothetical protein
VGGRVVAVDRLELDAVFAKELLGRRAGCSSALPEERDMLLHASSSLVPDAQNRSGIKYII